MNYLYNGVELPALPEWDKETYPYAVIYHSPFNTGDTAFYVGFLAELPKIITTENGDFARYADGKKSCILYFINTAVEEYSSWEISTQGTKESVCKSSLLVWANADIHYADDYSDETLAGTLYLAASDPIPVGGEPIDHASFLKGWVVGRRLAGMRK